MRAPSWESVLSEFEGCLTRQERLIAGRRYAELVEFVPPEGLGALPPGLLGRATDLLQRADAIAAEAGEALAGLARRGTQVQRRPAEGRAVSAYLDRRV